MSDKNKLNSINDVRNFDFQPKTKWYNLILVFVLSLILIFSGLLWLQNQAAISGATIERERIAKLNDDLYRVKQYDILDYKVGICSSLPCNKDNFSQQKEIGSCDERANISILTLIKSNVKKIAAISITCKFKPAMSDCIVSC